MTEHRCPCNRRARFHAGRQHYCYVCFMVTLAQLMWLPTEDERRKAVL